MSCSRSRARSCRRRPPACSPRRCGAWKLHVREMFGAAGASPSIARERVAPEFSSVEAVVQEYSRNFGPFVMARSVLEPQGPLGRVRRGLPGARAALRCRRRRARPDRVRVLPDHRRSLGAVGLGGGEPLEELLGREALGRAGDAGAQPPRELAGELARGRRARARCGGRGTGARCRRPAPRPQLTSHPSPLRAGHGNLRRAGHAQAAGALAHDQRAGGEVAEPLVARA